jgi:hypothetical protein
MGNHQSYERIDTSCGIDEQEPEAVEPPSFLILLSQKLELLCCPCTLSPQTIKHREFLAIGLPKISAGDVFVLESFTPVNKERGTVSKAASGILNFFSGSASSSSSSSSSSNASNPEDVQKLVGSPVFLSCNLDMMIRLKMTVNQITTRANVLLSDVHHVQAIREGQDVSFSCVDSKGLDICTFRTGDSKVRDEWVKYLSDFLVLYSDDIQSTLGKSEKEARRKERQLEITERRRQAKERIKNIGLTGMKHSAIARSNR